MTAGSKRQEQLEQVTFFVEGIPVPQGSKNVSRWGNVYDANHKELRAWRTEIAKAAHDASDHVFSGPVHVRVEFILPRPKTVKRIYPAVKPDLDKLLRALFDGMHCSGHKLLVDDSLVCSTQCSKRYLIGTESPGALITVSSL
jgi:Holliday junction resolvase RusA-like endonuclease